MLKNVLRKYFSIRLFQIGQNLLRKINPSQVDVCIKSPVDVLFFPSVARCCFIYIFCQGQSYVPAVRFVFQAKNTGCKTTPECVAVCIQVYCTSNSKSQFITGCKIVTETEGVSSRNVFTKWGLVCLFIIWKNPSPELLSGWYAEVKEVDQVRFHFL